MKISAVLKELQLTKTAVQLPKGVSFEDFEIHYLILKNPYFITTFLKNKKLSNRK